MKASFPRFDFKLYPSLTFEQADTKTFRNLGLAFQALEQGGNKACLLNAANEVAVAAFLEDQVGFLAMSDLNEYVMNQGTFIANPTLEDYIESDKLSRIMAQDWVDKNRK
jgi:1-deoxy-D-xylulose-5-phosphate reductoisomerase